MNRPDRPFNVFTGVASFFIIFAALMYLATARPPIPFVFGSILSFGWALISYSFEIDLPSYTQLQRAGKAVLGFFMIVVGITLAGIGPIYLNTDAVNTDWLVMWGVFFGTQVGLSLLLISPLKSPSFWCGYTANAIILHSAIFRFPNDFSDLLSAKSMVLVSIILSSWFLGVWLFFDNPYLDTIEETRRSKQAKSIIAIFSGLLTVIEFVNIMYTIISFR